MTNFEKIKALFALGINKDELLGYVKSGKITQDEYKQITNETCPALTLDELKTLKTIEIENAANTALVSGFHSSAYQGQDKIYSSDLNSRLLITGNATAAASKIAGVPSCKDDTFVYRAINETAYNSYTDEEIATLGRDLKVFTEQTLGKEEIIKGLIKSAATIDDLNKISWDMTLPTA